VYRGLSTDRLDRLDHALGRKLQLLARLHSAGVELRLGTDTQQPFVVPGLALHREMQLFGRAGIPTADIWRLATTDAAQALGRRLGEPALGRLEPDATADFLIYDRDPTDALDPATGLLAVVSGGALYRKGDLDRAVARQAAHFRQPFLRYLANTAAKRRIARAGFR
jgi:imidazolonepropionase-like amidohydrolase